MVAPQTYPINNEIIRRWKDLEMRADNALKRTQTYLVELREGRHFKRTWKTLFKYRIPKDIYITSRNSQLRYSNHFRSMRDIAKRMITY